LTVAGEKARRGDRTDAIQGYEGSFLATSEIDNEHEHERENGRDTRTVDPYRSGPILPSIAAIHANFLSQDPLRIVLVLVVVLVIEL
jgi:hypothetical protein